MTRYRTCPGGWSLWSHPVAGWSADRCSIGTLPVNSSFVILESIGYDRRILAGTQTGWAYLHPVILRGWEVKES